MMDEELASFAIDVMELACDGNWPVIAKTLLNKGYSKEEICEKWGAIEEEAGVSGIAPEIEDFDGLEDDEN